MSVKICIHQAAEKIGGNCVEIVSESGHRLLLDAGRPLDLKSGQPAVLPPSLDISADVDGLLLSHSHSDHWGLLTALPDHWPVHCGEDTAQLLRLNIGFASEPRKQPLTTWLRHGQPIVTIGPFTVKPRLIDHSAFDAHALLIEVDGRRIFYSGDFRGHGRKGRLTEALLADPPKDIDVLIMEGTNLPLNGDNLKPTVTEAELEDDFIKVFRETKGRVFVTWSATNIDRMVTLYRASLKTGRYLAVDLYTALVWREMTRFAVNLPGISAAKIIRVVITKNMVNVLKRLGYENPVPGLKKDHVAISARALEENPDKWVVMVRNSLAHFGYPGLVSPTRDDSWVWSQWHGYQEDEEKNGDLIKFMAPCGEQKHIHTSGHATPQLLKKLAMAVSPKILLPIHGEAWAQHQDDFENLHLLNNGQWLEV